MLVRIGLPSAIAIGLSSCTGTIPAPSASLSPVVSEQWQQPNPSPGPLDAAALTEWWNHFGDPTLDQLIAHALQTSPDIRTALARVEAARASHGVQRATLLPSLTASASGTHSRTVNRKTNATARSESAQASLDASWQLDLFGKARATTRATAADLAEAEENYHDAQVVLAAEVAADYVQLRSTEARQSIVQQTLGALEETLQFARWQEQSGTGSAIDTQSALGAVEQTRATLPSLQLSLIESRNQLAVLCGQPPGSLDGLLSSTGRIPTTASTLTVGIPAETLRQRPDVRAASRALEAAAARTATAKLERLPTLTLGGSIGVDALRAGSLFPPESSFTSLLGSLSAPIFSSGKITQGIQLQLAIEKQTLIAYESTVVTALSEVENALAALQQHRERLDALDRAVAAAGESYTFARQRYEAGTVDFLTVLDAQRSRLSLQESQISTTADLASAHIQLYKALGGGWTHSL